MPTATSTEASPSHHSTISDGTTTFGFVFVNSRGEPDPHAIVRTPIPRTALKMTQGSTRYGSLEFPYVPIAQDDWSGGRGLDDFERDSTRFADSYRLITRHQGKLMLGPHETYTIGYRNLNQNINIPGNVTWQTLTGSTRFVAYKFTTSAAYTAAKIYTKIRRRGTPGTLTCELRSDSPGDPGSVLQTATATTSNITDTVSLLYMFDITNQALSNATAYWVVIYGAGTDNSTNYWQVGTDAADTDNLTEISTAGSTWSNASFDLYFRIVDNNSDVGGILFEYKGALYCVKNTNSVSPRLYINGHRGVATGAGQSTTQLVDTSQTFTADALIGGTLVLTDGTGSAYGQTFSEITDNTTTAIIVSPALTSTPIADDTEYAVVGLETWTLIGSTGLTGPVTDVAVFGDFVYFAQADWNQIRWMWEFNSNGTWNRSFGSDVGRMTFLKVVHDPQRGDRLWGAANRDPHGKRSVSSAIAENGVLSFPLIIDDADDNWTQGTNVTATVDETDYVEGSGSVQLVVAAGASAQILAYEDITNLNLLFYRKISFWAKSSIDLTEGDLQLRLSAASDASTSILDFNFPDMAAGVWTFVTRPITRASGLRAVSSVGIEMVVDVGAFTLHIDSIMVTPGSSYGTYVELPSGYGLINGLAAYDDPEELWVFREGQAGHVTNGIFVPVPLEEMAMARSRNNGRASTSFGVYLFFSYLQGLERYYRNNLDDVGPDRDEGLPDERRGPIAKLISYPGRIFASIAVDSTRYSSILDVTRLGWHEWYRCSEAGQSIENMHVQVVPGWTVDRLWFVQGQDILWLPLPGNTLREDTDPDFRFTHEGTVESGWLYGGMQDVVKFYNSLKLLTTGTSSTKLVEADYRTNETATWTALPSAFDTFIEEIGFSSATPPSVTGRRLRYRLRMMTNDATVSPIIKASVVEAIGRVPIKYSYTFSFKVGDENTDLEGDDDSYSRAETMITQLDTWANAATPLTWRCAFSPFDNKTVLVDPASLRPTTLMPDDQLEAHIGQLTVIEA